MLLLLSRYLQDWEVSYGCSKDTDKTWWISTEYKKELGDYFYITQLLSGPSTLDLHIIATLS